jgi:hypothetical protein
LIFSVERKLVLQISGVTADVGEHNEQQKLIGDEYKTGFWYACTLTS